MYLFLLIWCDLKVSESDSDTSHVTHASSASSVTLSTSNRGHGDANAALNDAQHQQIKVRFQQLVDEGQRSLKRGDFTRAVEVYTEALQLDPNNHLLFTNRSLAFIKTRSFEKALQDARAARTLKPTWVKVRSAMYYLHLFRFACLMLVITLNVVYMLYILVSWFFIEFFVFNIHHGLSFNVYFPTTTIGMWKTTYVFANICVLNIIFLTSKITWKHVNNYLCVPSIFRASMVEPFS